MIHLLLYLALSFAAGAIAMLSALVGLAKVAGEAPMRSLERRQRQ